VTVGLAKTDGLALGDFRRCALLGVLPQPVAIRLIETTVANPPAQRWITPRQFLRRFSVILR